MKIKKNKKAALAITQILILLVGIVAISYAIGSSVEVVSAGELDGTTPCEEQGGVCADDRENDCTTNFVSDLCTDKLSDSNWRCCKPKEGLSAKEPVVEDPIIDEPVETTTNWMWDTKCGYKGINCGICSKCCPPSDGSALLEYQCSTQNLGCGGVLIPGCFGASNIPTFGTKTPGLKLAPPLGSIPIINRIGHIGSSSATTEDGVEPEITGKHNECSNGKCVKVDNTKEGQVDACPKIGEVCGEVESEITGKHNECSNGKCVKVDNTKEGQVDVCPKVGEDCGGSVEKKCPPCGDGQKCDETSKTCVADSTSPEGFWDTAWEVGKVIGESAAVAYGVYQGVQFIGGLFAPDAKEEVDAASNALSAGVGTYNLISKLFVGDKALIGAGIKGAWAGVAGVAVAIAVYLYTYKKTNEEIITFECLPWAAPTGGSKCEECNKQGDLPCSEYQCRSLGQACQIVNPGTDEEKCVWVNRNDVAAPIIQAWDDALINNQDYRYVEDHAIAPPDRGVKIQYLPNTGDNCVPAFTPVSFGIILDEPAKCKLDITRKENFEDMNFYFGGSSLLKYNHTQTMNLPSAAAIASENLTIQNDGEFELYVKCSDANGNTNTANFGFKYCVDKGPDTTPPLIAGTSIFGDEQPIAYDQTEVLIDLYVNEPSECKWSHRDQNYDNMEYQMDCSGANSLSNMNPATGMYSCEGTLDSLRNRDDNEFYFRCKDQPQGVAEDRNTNQDSYKINLIGTQPLVIDSVGPEETIRDSTEIIKVTLEAETSAGYQEGKSTCYYSTTDKSEDYISFFESDSHEHSQDLYLSEGDYKYFIKCIDLGGNSDTKELEFVVESDTSAPVVVRAFKDGEYLKIITSEEGNCVYGTTDCNYLFEDGLEMRAFEDIEHFIDWDVNTNLYIKCQDTYGNQPLPNECNIIVKPFDLLF